ncbi:MAG TPA: KUP/HAK/KT family potassium transporter [Gemmatimonadota bacterium]
MLGLAFGALGVVYGDIGTSPLYALKACFNIAGGGVAPTPENVFGVLSLVLWSLVLVVSVKYIGFVMRADNRGEGGILALLALAAPTRESRLPYRRALVLLGLFGAALLYGDGMITPAISVLGAVEGLQQATPVIHRFIVPLAAAVLVALFLIQSRGTHRVAALFSPITLIWFVAIAILGVWGIAHHPRVLGAANPTHAVRFFAANGIQGFLTLGFVFLAVTGAEALYADMGHFGRLPIRLAWLGVVFPALLLNYFGQGGLLISDPGAAVNPFYALVPQPLLYPMVALATAAAVVASQALISGAFSLTHQAVQLGYLPRTTIVHTSAEMRGQIYVPTVNHLLMLASVGLTIGFGSADALAAAYGIAVSGTMTITTLLFYVVLRSRLGWSPHKAGLLCATFLLGDVAFLSANLVKIHEGGWFPLLVAGGVFAVMYTWVEGRTALLRVGARRTLPLEVLVEDVERRRLPRVPGTAVFMSPSPGTGAPLVLLHHLKHNKALHENVILLSIVTEDVPKVRKEERMDVSPRGAGFYDVIVHYGFTETPDAPRALAASERLKEIYQPSQATFYLGHHTLLPTGHAPIALWRKHLFTFLYRNALPATSHFGLPPNRIVEVGAQVPL